jgi:hypothetical protein
MDPHTQFCHHPDCPARGQLDLGHIRVHSRKQRRDRGTTCGRTFAATQDTPFYRLGPAPRFGFLFFFFSSSPIRER